MKKIFFLADSSVDLKSVYILLKKQYEISWVYYHKNLKFDFLNLGCDKKNIFFLYNLTFILIFKKIFSRLGFFKINYENEALKKITHIDRKYKPDLWITDTGNLLSQLNLNAPKLTFKHSVCYKKYFLKENTFKYDYICIPGIYHYKRIAFAYSNKFKEIKKKLLISFFPKILPYIKNRNRNNLNSFFFKKTQLDKSKKNVLLAPTHDAFFARRFLPKKFNDESLALKKICNIVTKEFNYNLIIKLHHYHHEKLNNIEFNFLRNLKNVYVFKSNKNFDSLESESFFLNSDIIITDTSGVGPLGCFLDKQMIYLNPDKQFNWKDADIEKSMRPGFIWSNIVGLRKILKEYHKYPYLFKKERLNFRKKIFKYQKLKDAGIILKQIKKILYNN
jgi:hypothetical protein